MKVADLVRKPVRSIIPDATVEEALVDTRGRMVGVISSTDLLVAEAEAAHKDTLRQLAEETEVRAESQCRSWHRDSSLRSE